MPDCANTPEYTTFQEVYDAFTSGITDDMFMEMTKEDTDEILEELLMAALPHFEFPRQDIFNLDKYNKRFKCLLTAEEIRIIRSYMVVEWINYQLASIENVRQKSIFQIDTLNSVIIKLYSVKYFFAPVRAWALN